MAKRCKRSFDRLSLILVGREPKYRGLPEQPHVPVGLPARLTMIGRIWSLAEEVCGLEGPM